MMEFIHLVIFIKIALQVVKRFKKTDKKERIEKDCDKKEEIEKHCDKKDCHKKICEKTSS